MIQSVHRARIHGLPTHPPRPLTFWDHQMEMKKKNTATFRRMEKRKDVEEEKLCFQFKKLNCAAPESLADSFKRLRLSPPAQQPSHGSSSYNGTAFQSLNGNGENASQIVLVRGCPTDVSVLSTQRSHGSS